MMLRKPILRLLPALTFAALVVAPAHADDQPFVTLYTTDIDPQDGREVEQWLSWKTGHHGASYNELLSQSEIEYGLTDDLQGSLYFDYDWSRQRAAPGPADTDSVAGASGELIYRLMNVYFDPFGAALYLEPSYSQEERGIEAKILLQKNFFHDALRWAVNINIEDDWDRDQGRWTKVSALEFDTGLSYNITAEFSAGVEFDNERAFDGLVLGTPSSEQSSAFYIGPAVQYVGRPLTVTLGVQTQLPWADAHAAGIVHDGFVADAERYRIIFRLSHDF